MIEQLRYSDRYSGASLPCLELIAETSSLVPFGGSTRCLCKHDGPANDCNYGMLWHVDGSQNHRYMTGNYHHSSSGL